MENDNNLNPERFKVGRASESKTAQPDDSNYTAQENQFADGKGTELAEQFEAPDPEDIDEDEQEILTEDIEVDDDKDLNQALN